MIIYKKGSASNIINPNTLIIHIVNNLGLWGKGFVLALSEKDPSIRQEYINFCLPYKNNKNNLLGQFFISKRKDYSVAHLFAQDGIYSKFNRTPIDYIALEISLNKLYREILCLESKNNEKFFIQLPKISSGLARGNWNKTEGIIKKIFIEGERELDLTVFELE